LLRHRRLQAPRLIAAPGLASSDGNPTTPAPLAREEPDSSVDGACPFPKNRALGQRLGLLARTFARLLATRPSGPP